MVMYTCKDQECARVFHQEPAYINHMLKHLNQGGEYVRDLSAQRKRRAATPKSAAQVAKKKSREERRIESAREEWEQRQKRRKEEADAARALTTQPARRRRRRKVYKKIASGRVGSAGGQGEVVDLRSPSRSPSIECITPQDGTSRRFDVSPDSTVPSMSRNSTPGGVSDIDIISLHHLTASLPSISDSGNQYLGTNTQKVPTPASRETSEEAVLAHHHSALTYPTPQASRETSEEAIVDFHHSSISLSPAQVDQEMNEETVVAFHHRSVSDSPTQQVNRGISEEAIVRHHHSSPLTSFRQPLSPGMSEETVAACHHMSASLSTDSMYNGRTSEQDIVRHHHSVSTSPQPQSSAETSEESVIACHHSDRANAGVKERVCIDPSVPVKNLNLKKLDLNDVSIKKAATSLLEPFAFPSLNPSTPLIDHGVKLDDPYSHYQAGQGMSAINVCKEETLAKDSVIQPSRDIAEPIPSTPQSSSHTTLAISNVSKGPMTPSRLGPTWKTETAPHSVIDEYEINDLESELESDDDADENGITTPSSPTPFHYRSQSLFKPSFQGPLVASSPSEASRREDVDIDLETDAWAFEHGIDPRQRDDVRHETHSSVALNDSIMDDGSGSDNDRDCSGEETDSEEYVYDEEEEEEEEDRDEGVVEGECGYRVFAGYSDLDFIEADQWDDRHDTTSTQVRDSTFGLLSPKRPTALEATLGCESQGSPSNKKLGSESPRSSRGRVSAKLDSPSPTTPRAAYKHARSGLASPYALQYKYLDQTVGHATPMTPRGPIVGLSVLKRDQVLLALLQSGHVGLAEDLLRGET